MYVKTLKPLYLLIRYQRQILNRSQTIKKLENVAYKIFVNRVLCFGTRYFKTNLFIYLPKQTHSLVFEGT